MLLYSTADEIFSTIETYARQEEISPSSLTNYDK